MHLLPQTKRNHSPSRFYIGAWASTPGLVYRFDKSTGRWSERSLKKQAGVVREAYTQGAENWFAKAVETPVAPVIEQLRKFDTKSELVLDGENRFRVAVFMIETYLHAVAARRRVAPAVAQMSTRLGRTPLERRLLEDAKEEILEDPGRASSPLVRDAPGRHSHLMAYECVEHGQWAIYYTTDTDRRRHLVTSDDPVLRFPATATDDYGPMPGGRLDHFLMPLSPRRFLVCRKRSGRLFERLTEPIRSHPDADIVVRTYCLTNRQIKYTNLLMARTAWKHVFASRPVRRIEGWEAEDFPNWPRLFPDAPKQG